MADHGAYMTALTKLTSFLFFDNPVKKAVKYARKSVRFSAKFDKIDKESEICQF